jgi:hypothetical protein
MQICNITIKLNLLVGDGVVWTMVQMAISLKQVNLKSYDFQLQTCYLGLLFTNYLQLLCFILRRIYYLTKNFADVKSVGWVPPILFLGVKWPEKQF